MILMGINDVLAITTAPLTYNIEALQLFMIRAFMQAEKQPRKLIWYKGSWNAVLITCRIFTRISANQRQSW